MSETVRPPDAVDEQAIIAHVVELATAGQGVKAVAQTLNREAVPTLRHERRWTTSGVHDTLRQRAVERFDSMPLRDKVRWIDRLARVTKLESSMATMLGHELRAFSRSVGVGFAWADEQRPLNGRDVYRIHEAVRQGFAALWQSGHVPTIKATDKQAILRAARGANSAGWVLPRHRIRLRRIPAPAHGERTSVYAVYEAPDEVSAIVAAIGHFVWRYSGRWRDCACGRCGLTFVASGKQRFIDTDHANQHRQRRHYDKNKDVILQKRRTLRQSPAVPAGREGQA